MTVDDGVELAASPWATRGPCPPATVRPSHDSTAEILGGVYFVSDRAPGRRAQVSLMHCMPQGLNCNACGERGAGLGMMWGRERARAMLRDAGSARVWSLCRSAAGSIGLMP